MMLEGFMDHEVAFENKIDILKDKIDRHLE